MSKIINIKREDTYKFTCNFKSKNEMFRAMKILQMNNIDVKVDNIFASNLYSWDNERKNK